MARFKPTGPQGDTGATGATGPAGPETFAVVSATEPNNPEQGELWYDTNSSTMNVYVGSAYVALVPSHNTWDFDH